MPKYLVANIYIMRCLHEVEADNEQRAIMLGMDEHDDLEHTLIEYHHTELVEQQEEE